MGTSYYRGSTYVIAFASPDPAEVDRVLGRVGDALVRGGASAIVVDVADCITPEVGARLFHWFERYGETIASRVRGVAFVAPTLYDWLRFRVGITVMDTRGVPVVVRRSRAAAELWAEDA